MSYTTTQVTVDRLTFVSSKPVHQVIQAFESWLSSKLEETSKIIDVSKRTAEEKEKVWGEASKPLGLFLFRKFNMSETQAHFFPSPPPITLRYLVGNPFIMQRISQYIPDVVYYAPRTVVITDRLDGVHLIYNTMASYLASSESSEGLKLARELDEIFIFLLGKAANGEQAPPSVYNKEQL